MYSFLAVRSRLLYQMFVKFTWFRKIVFKKGIYLVFSVSFISKWMFARSMTMRIRHLHSRRTTATTDAFERPITRPAMVSSSEHPARQPCAVLFDALGGNASKIAIATTMITSMTIAAQESPGHIKVLD